MNLRRSRENSVSEMLMESKKGFLLFLMEIQALMVKSY
jgi:hypothetical protein